MQPRWFSTDATHLISSLFALLETGFVSHYLVVPKARKVVPFKGSLFMFWCCASFHPTFFKIFMDAWFLLVTNQIHTVFCCLENRVSTLYTMFPLSGCKLHTLHCPQDNFAAFHTNALLYFILYKYGFQMLQVSWPDCIVLFQLRKGEEKYGFVIKIVYFLICFLFETKRPWKGAKIRSNLIVGTSHEGRLVS